MAQRDGLGVASLKAIVGALIGTLAARWVALLALDVPPEFPPLAGVGPTIFFTVVGALGAVGVYALVRRFSARPSTVFRWIAAVVLVLSFIPDLALLGEGAAETFPGATPAGVGVLMVMHVVAAAIIVWALTGGEGPTTESGEPS